MTDLLLYLAQGFVGALLVTYALEMRAVRRNKRKNKETDW